MPFLSNDPLDIELHAKAKPAEYLLYMNAR